MRSAWSIRAGACRAEDVILADELVERARPASAPPERWRGAGSLRRTTRTGRWQAPQLGFRLALGLVVGIRLFRTISRTRAR